MYAVVTLAVNSREVLHSRYYNADYNSGQLSHVHGFGPETNPLDIVFVVEVTKWH